MPRILAATCRFNAELPSLFQVLIQHKNTEIDQISTELQRRVEELQQKNEELQQKEIELGDKNIELRQKGIDLQQKDIEFQQKDNDHRRSQDIIRQQNVKFDMHAYDNNDNPDNCDCVIPNIAQHTHQQLLEEKHVCISQQQKQLEVLQVGLSLIC